MLHHINTVMDYHKRNVGSQEEHSKELLFPEFFFSLFIYLFIVIYLENLKIISQYPNMSQSRLSGASLRLANKYFSTFTEDSRRVAQCSRHNGTNIFVSFFSPSSSQWPSNSLNSDLTLPHALRHLVCSGTKSRKCGLSFMETIPQCLGLMGQLNDPGGIDKEV